MSAPEPLSALRFPYAEAPAYGATIEVAPGILWLRLPLPYALDHVNVYLFEEPGGWTLFDTGIADDPSYELWERVLAGVLGGRPIIRLVVSHFHPDHVGMAGWLHERFAPPLHMTRTEYLYTRLLQTMPRAARTEDRPFYQALGLTPAEIGKMLNTGKSYLQRVTGIAASYHRLIAGETIDLGGRTWRILTGGGHAPEQAMLHCEAEHLFLSADQVLAKISPNVSVFEIEPQADPLGIYLASLRAIREAVPDDVRVMPCHNLPFDGLHERIGQLIRHHEYRCELITTACAETALTCLELIPILFKRPLDIHTLGFALGEGLAHLNYLVFQNRLRPETRDGVVRYRTV